MRPLVDGTRLAVDDDPAAAYDHESSALVVGDALRRDETDTVVLYALTRERLAVARSSGRRRVGHPQRRPREASGLSALLASYFS